MVLKDLLAVGLLDLVFSSPPAVLRKTEDLVVILGLDTKKNVNKSNRGTSRTTYLPVLGLTLEHHGVLGLALVADITIFDVLGTLLSLDTVVLGEGALVAGSSSVGEEVRTDRLDASLSSLRKLADSLEVLIGSPATGEGGERECHSSYGSHYVVYGFDGEERNSDGFLAATIFFFNGAASISPTMDVIGGVKASVGHDCNQTSYSGMSALSCSAASV